MLTDAENNPPPTMESPMSTIWLPKEIQLISKVGITPEEVAQEYDKWAIGAKYDKDNIILKFNAPTVTAKALERYYENQKEIRILDIGAGTGSVAEQLKKLGFHNIDALDPSDGMLKVAKDQNLYVKYLCAFFTEHVDILETSSYDAVVTCGTMVQGHLKIECMNEMVRCVKPGGVVVIVMREATVQTAPEFKGRLEPYMQQMEEKGLWKRLEKTIFPRYALNHQGVTFVFRITKSEK